MTGSYRVLKGGTLGGWAHAKPFSEEGDGRMKPSDATSHAEARDARIPSHLEPRRGGLAQRP